MGPLPSAERMCASSGNSCSASIKSLPLPDEMSSHIRLDCSLSSQCSFKTPMVSSSSFSKDGFFSFCFCFDPAPPFLLSRKTMEMSSGHSGQKYAQPTIQTSHLLQVFKVLLLVLGIVGTTVEIFQLRKVLLFLQDLLESRRVLAWTKPRTWSVAFPILLDPLLRLLGYAHDLEDSNLAILAHIYLLESITIRFNTISDIVTVQIVQKTCFHRWSRLPLSVESKVPACRFTA
mmetsp:Transcript_11404/g.27536  ORF Transcript_11404/g.27536 Transcript_11404/m.27536 type:complete len:232 (+) Transcript_11404:156-851(+)